MLHCSFPPCRCPPTAWSAGASSRSWPTATRSCLRRWRRWRAGRRRRSGRWRSSWRRSAHAAQSRWVQQGGAAGVCTLLPIPAGNILSSFEPDPRPSSTSHPRLPTLPSKYCYLTVFFPGHVHTHRFPGVTRHPPVPSRRRRSPPCAPAWPAAAPRRRTSGSSWRPPPRSTSTTCGTRSRRWSSCRDRRT